MKLEFVTQIVKKACHYYERKVPQDATIDLWNDKVKNIPDAAAGYIEAHITDSDIAPKNFPSVFWALYLAWQRANPEKMATEKFFECTDCYEGIIYARKNRYRYIFRCIKCKQCRTQSYPKALKRELEAQGYAIENPGTGYSGKEGKERTMAYMKKMGISMGANNDSPF